MSAMNWDQDPELKEMRRSFLISLTPRRNQLEAWLSSLAIQTTPDAIEGVQYVAHKLAGTAETYGFGVLSRIGLALDELIDLSGEGLDPGLVYRGGALLAVALEWATEQAVDPGHLLTDPVFVELDSCVSALSG